MHSPRLARRLPGRRHLTPILFKALRFLPVLLFLAPSNANADDRLIAAARTIEGQLGARVGLAVFEPATGRWSSYNADERFPMVSTFKVLACAALLASDVPDAPTMTVGTLQEYSPVTQHLVGQKVSPYQLCEATMRTSDNTAANLVLEAIGGPQAVTRFVQSHGDRTTRLDRWEPELNEGTPGDARDTTTPQAFVETLNALILGDVLSAADRKTLLDWMKSNEVADPLLRAGIPSDWIIGDRTGAGGYGTRGIVAVMWPESEAPIVAAIFLTETRATLDQRNAAIAELGRVLAEKVSKQ